MSDDKTPPSPRAAPIDLSPGVAVAPDAGLVTVAPGDHVVAFTDDGATVDVKAFAAKTFRPPKGEIAAKRAVLKVAPGVVGLSLESDDGRVMTLCLAPALLEAYADSFYEAAKVARKLEAEAAQAPVGEG